MPGLTVFYRLSEENVFDIRHARGARATEPYILDGIVEPPRHQIWHGAPVEIGMYLPAEVVKAYSVYEYAVENNILKESGYDEKEARKSFSGYADIRVKLPGNDTLWVPRAEQDNYPTPAPEAEQYGHSTLYYPAVGKYTVVQPASLLY